jgi:hypothetical protein
LPTTNRRPELNLPLLALWVAAAVVAGTGAWMLLTGNAAQADFYDQGGSDYAELLGLQSRTIVGGLLIAAGVLGLLLALATHAHPRAGALAANAVSATEAAPEATDDVDGDRLAHEPEYVEHAPHAETGHAPHAGTEPEAEPGTIAERDVEPTRA